jgi:hypothetical protein
LADFSSLDVFTMHPWLRRFPATLVLLAVATLGVAEEPAKPPRAWWRPVAGEYLRNRGRTLDAVDAAEGHLPRSMVAWRAGPLGLLLERTRGGVDLVALHDCVAQQKLLAPKTLPLFVLTLHSVSSAEEIRLAADAGWNNVEFKTSIAGDALEIRWQKPQDARLGELTVVVRAIADAESGALRWRVTAAGQADPWRLVWLVFPQVALSAGTAQARVLLPQGPGVVRGVARGQLGRFGEVYPSRAACMQFTAFYDPGRKTGLYFAAHDSLASPKRIIVEERGDDPGIRLALGYPVIDADKAGNRFVLPGEVVWQRLDGDWFDAAVIYRDWVRKVARWWPQLTRDGREDTPRWFRELSVWTTNWGCGEHNARRVEEFAGAIGASVGDQWYGWSVDPLEHDAAPPAAKKGFAEDARRLKLADVYVMLYLDGRLSGLREHAGEADLWLPHGRRIPIPPAAVPADAVKDRHAQAIYERYDAVEPGRPAALAVMCPAAEAWQKRAAATVAAVLKGCDVPAVYLDQVASAPPRPCFDVSHGHPTGMGAWWTAAGYWRLLDGVRQAMPAGRVLTTQGNADAYVRWFDGYLTWHWQYDGQVPAFPAVYGGAIQMFGRSFYGCPLGDPAVRMKLGQQLVFGEQLGWIDADVVRQRETFAFLRQLVQLRVKLARYFYAGEMARPPQFSATMPTMKGDWHGPDPSPVTTDAVLCGGWWLRGENRLALLFVNVSDRPIVAHLRYDARAYGLPAGNVRAAVTTSQGTEPAAGVTGLMERDASFPPQTAWALELALPEGQ